MFLHTRPTFIFASGAEIYLYGSGNCTYTYQIDNEGPIHGGSVSSIDRDSLLGSFKGLPLGQQHTIIVNTSSSSPDAQGQQLALDRIVVTTDQNYT